MSDTERFRARYRDAFADYVTAGDEADLQAAYELGREAVAQEVSVLELASIHHDVLLEALRGRDTESVVRAAADFFVESLSAFEIVRRAFQEAREAALVERKQAAILRQLSNFLADASLAIGEAGSVEEALQLVAEHAREMVDAAACVVRVETPPLEARSGEETGPARLEAPLTGLDGRVLGRIELYGDGFSEVDEAVAVQVAQMASAALERATVYAASRSS